MAGSAKSKQNYSYSRIADLKSGLNNVIGVIKFTKVPVKSRGPDYVQVLSIADESTADKLVVNLFYGSVKDFPPASVGDVIRLHRVRVQSINGEPKGQPGPGFSWLLVQDDVDNPTVSSKVFTYTDQTKKRVQELQRWGREQSWGQRFASLSELVPTQYCDVVCQVVGVGTFTNQNGTCFVARVWDGTKCPYQVTSTEETLDVDEALGKKAGHLAVDIWVYDDHVPSCQRIQPGHFIKLCNLHADVFKGDNGEASSGLESPTLELVVHHGTAYGRGVVLLQEQSPLVAAVKGRIDRSLSGRPEAGTSEPVSGAAHTSGGEPMEQQNLNQQLILIQNQNNNNLASTSALPLPSDRKDPAHASSSEQGATITPAAEKDSAHDANNRPTSKQHRADSEAPESERRDRTPATSRDQCPAAPHAGSSLHGNEDNPIVLSSDSLDSDGQAAPSVATDREATAARRDHPGKLAAASDIGKTGQRWKEGSGRNSGGGGEGERNLSGESFLPDNELGHLMSSSDSGSGNKDRTASLPSSTETCMLKTASVISGHQHISHTTIRNVLHHTVPHKFRVLAHLVDFYPDTLDPYQLLRHLCPKCFFLSPLDRATVSSAGETSADPETQKSTVKSFASSITSKLAGFLGGGFANWNPDTDTQHSPEPEISEPCPRCKTDGEAVPLELTYMLRLVLQDSSGDFLVANLWRDNAVTFFQGLSPELALLCKDAMEEQLQKLRSYCVGGCDNNRQPPSSLPPRLDCCLFSYKAGGDVNFHVFDTVLM